MCKCPFYLPGTKYCSTAPCMFSVVHVMYYFLFVISVETCTIVGDKDAKKLFFELH